MAAVAASGEAITAPCLGQDAAGAAQLPAEDHADMPLGRWTDEEGVHHHVSCGVVLFRGTDVLLIKSNLTHMWGCCKGHVEPGDASLRATALRELHEESGVPPDAVTLLPDWRHTIHYTYRRKEGAVHDKTVHWFTGTCPASIPAALSDETEDVAWLDVATACRKLRNGQLKRLLRKCAAALGIEAPPPPQSKPQAGGRRRGRQVRHVRRGQAPGEAAGTHQPPPKRSG